MTKLSLQLQEVRLPDTREFRDFLNRKPWSTGLASTSGLPSEAPSLEVDSRSSAQLLERLTTTSSAEERSSSGECFFKGVKLEPHLTTANTRTSLDTLNGAGCGELEKFKASILPKIKQEVQEVARGVLNQSEDEQGKEKGGVEGLGGRQEESPADNGAEKNGEKREGSSFPGLDTPPGGDGEVPVPVLDESPQASENGDPKINWIQCDLCFRWRHEKNTPISNFGRAQHWSCDIDGRKCTEACDWCEAEVCNCRFRSSYKTEGFLMSGYTLPPGFQASMKFRAGREPLTIGGPYLLYLCFCKRCGMWSGGMDRKQKLAAWLHAHRDHHPDWAKLTELDFDFRLDEWSKELNRAFCEAKRAGVLRVGPSDDVVPTVVVGVDDGGVLQEKVKQFEKLVKDCQTTRNPTVKRKRSNDLGGPGKRVRLESRKTGGEVEGAKMRAWPSAPPVCRDVPQRLEYQELKKSAEVARLGNVLLAGCSTDHKRVFPSIVVASATTGGLKREGGNVCSKE